MIAYRQLRPGIVTILNIEDLDIAGEPWRYYPGMHLRYVTRSIARKTVYLHRVVAERMGLTGQCIDHINRNPLDNRRCNLRSATHCENAYNSTARTGAKGVNWQKDHGMWRARIRVAGNRVHLGYFESESEAAAAYRAAAESFHKEFACE
jgi:hypothetical protein